MSRKKILKKRYYTMPISSDGKRHRVWHEYSDFHWKMLMDWMAMTFYGDVNSEPKNIIGIQARFEIKGH